MIRSLKIALACGALALATIPAVASAEVETVSEAALDDMRGGFNLNGLNIGFGVDLRSFVDGALVMESRLTMDPQQAGATVQNVASQMLTPQALADIGARVNAGLSGAGMSFGAATPDGITVLHHLGDGQLSNVLINTADNRDLRQEIAITLTLPGFGDTQAGMEAARLGQDLASQTNIFAAGGR
ncbi:MAG: hypothetical protein BGN86_10515 [Caulobacterales bacterium 68-7]|nr:hypothetical protein [Caulobacterales bacterium]OJU11225.1 MAG: hypothetical protein BGN86_10515 [Caulobacterales bacterium 68-7]